jgi:hypothetical protein
MSANSVPAGRALDWVVEGSKALMVNPMMFVGMSLLVIVANFIPVVNMVVGLGLPIIQAGVLYALREQAHGREVKFEYLFAGFTMEGKLVPLILLCIPALVAGILIVVVMFVFLGGAIFGLAAGSSQGGDVSTGASVFAGGSVIIGVLLMLAVGIAVGAAMFFAVPRVMFDGVDPIAALKESLAACLKNIPAMLMLIAIGFGILIVCLIPILGWALMLVLVCVGIVWSCSIQFQAYCDVFGDHAHDAVLSAPVTPPPAP